VPLSYLGADGGRGRALADPPRSTSAGGRLGQVEDVDYLAFILPGLLVMTVAGQAFANASTSLFQAKNEGYTEDVLTSPLGPAEVALSYMVGGVLRGWLAAAVVSALAAPFTDGVRRPLLALASLILTGVIFSALGVMTGSMPTASTSTPSSPTS